ncbi:hypothetical protein PSACC_03317 [Paramicrosporidium saccamoebae]|uniref:Uncharacterized protein n=1 Tax=Paramicrosporidium saccamoebae TaxID=1246581 RepID=A0A2H9TGG3_9FUNG|nr:hypothetical protein PSACC_03317 [Paramicrosporidium saccamoebae]
MKRGRIATKELRAGDGSDEGQLAKTFEVAMVVVGGLEGSGSVVWWEGDSDLVLEGPPGGERAGGHRGVPCESLRFRLFGSTHPEATHALFSRVLAYFIQKSS